MIQWRRRDSNSQPLPCKGSALPIELRPHKRESSTSDHFVKFQNDRYFELETKLKSGRARIRIWDLVVISDAL